MARYRHYKCLIEPKMTGFFTTTCLDFNHAISRDSLKTIALATVCDDCIYYGAPLHAFAIMSNHMHLIATMSPNQSGSAFMQKIKEHTAKALLPQLTDDEQTGFDHQRGLNNRLFWQRGFDSFPLVGKGAFLQ